ncbi:HAMP domain-containing sensor histidine kinase [Hydrogenobacter thermophilus]|uniref:sensor histidine kinase n=1 Tax=Hydrogenobacter thermophilus TaxID=940 RepID=UPI0030F644AA
MNSLFVRVYIIFSILISLAFISLYVFVSYTLQQTLNEEIEWSLRTSWQSIASLIQEDGGFQYDEEVFSIFRKGSGNYLLVKQGNRVAEIQPDEYVLDFPQRYGFYTFEWKGRLIAGFIKSYEGYTIGVYRDVSEKRSYKNTLLKKFTLGWFLLLILFLLLSYVLWFLSLRNIRKLAKSIEISTPEELKPINIKLPSEFMPLLNSYNKLIERLNVYIQNQRLFLYHLSHQLKTPLSIIRTAVDLAFRQNRKKEELLNLLLNIRASVEKALKITEKMLFLYRLESKSHQTNLENFNLKLLIEEVLDELLPLIDKKNLTVDVKLDDVILEADKELVYSILINLVENAVKYSPIGGKIEITTNKGCLYISDNGPGIQEEDMEKVFEPFYRGSNVLSQEGSGLGLSISRAIAQLFGWKILLENKRNGGLLVKVCFSA